MLLIMHYSNQRARMFIKHKYNNKDALFESTRSDVYKTLER